MKPISDFKAKMYQIHFRLGSGGAYSAPLDLLAGLRAPTSKGRRREGEGVGERRDGKGRGGEGTRHHPFTPPP